MILTSDGKIYYSNIKEKMIYKAEIHKNKKVIHTALFKFYRLSSRYSFKFYSNPSRSLIIVKDSSNSCFAIIKEKKSEEATFEEDIADIQITELNCYVILNDKKYTPSIQVFDLYFNFKKIIQPNWSMGTLAKAYTLGYSDFFFKVEDGIQAVLKIYKVTSNFRFIRKRKFKFGGKKMFVRNLYLAKDLGEKYIFLYHVDDQLMVFKFDKKNFYVEKISDSLKIPLAEQLTISNGIWAWGKNYLSYISPVYELFD